MLEIHPFGNFVPPHPHYLMLGSFVTKPTHPYDWFYANGRNHFWPIMGQVYNQVFDTKTKQQRLFRQLRMALADIILSCERRRNSNLDVNLYNITYNFEAIINIIQINSIETIFFTSRYVETLFKRYFKKTIQTYPEIDLICLPSPSPRYARLTLAEKVVRYRQLLPLKP
jgi:hypoxanthine-DNA glycosylase